MITIENIKETLADELCMDSAEFEKSLNNKMSDYVDSLEKIEVAIALEDKFNIRIPDSTIEKWDTIQDTVNTVNEICSLKVH